jgi:hypothetical protein
MDHNMLNGEGTESLKFTFKNMTFEMGIFESFLTKIKFGMKIAMLSQSTIIMVVTGPMYSCSFLIHYYQNYSNAKLIAFIIALDSAIPILRYLKSRSNFNEGLENLRKREDICITTMKELEVAISSKMFQRQLDLQ